MTIPPPVEVLKARLAPLARQSGLRLLVLFGSAARGETARAPEDLDLGALPAGPFDPLDFTNGVIRSLALRAGGVGGSIAWNETPHLGFVGQSTLG